ncbi:MAG: hypothetical protein J4F41_01975 [Alphaproteobacteria bacterium]|nr:hypothetical protein [Alphaproteobacteria bacterium]
MPLLSLTIAIPVLHSSGGWIASAAGSYIAGTLSSTWIGAFVAGNASIVAITGGGGIILGMGALVSTGTAWLGAALTSVGLGGLAIWLGLVPVTYFGLTSGAWILIGAVIFVVLLILFLLRKFRFCFFKFSLKRRIDEINLERVKGGLAPITVNELIKMILTHRPEKTD